MKLNTILFASLIGVSLSAGAAESFDSISEKLHKITGFQVSSVSEHPSGLYEIVTGKGIFYSTADGEYLFNGSLHEFGDGLKNLTRQKKTDVAKQTIAELKKDFISYPAANEKYAVMVFFDTSCGYCRKMHNEISRYNALGITINYAMWPRQGVFVRGSNNVYTQGYRNMESVACSANPQLAMNMVMRGTPIEKSSCDNSIEKSFELGQWLEVNGTPAVYDMEGNQVARGYLPPDRLLKTLESRG